MMARRAIFGLIAVLLLRVPGALGRRLRGRMTRSGGSKAKALATGGQPSFTNKLGPIHDAVGGLVERANQQNTVKYAAEGALVVDETKIVLKQIHDDLCDIFRQAQKHTPLMYHGVANGKYDPEAGWQEQDQFRRQFDDLEKAALDNLARYFGAIVHALQKMQKFAGTYASLLYSLYGSGGLDQAFLKEESVLMLQHAIQAGQQEAGGSSQQVPYQLLHDVFADANGVLQGTGYGSKKAVKLFIGESFLGDQGAELVGEFDDMWWTFASWYRAAMAKAGARHVVILPKAAFESTGKADPEKFMNKVLTLAELPALALHSDRVLFEVVNMEERDDVSLAHHDPAWYAGVEAFDFVVSLNEQWTGTSIATADEHNAMCRQLADLAAEAAKERGANETTGLLG